MQSVLSIMSSRGLVSSVPGIGVQYQNPPLNKAHPINENIKRKSEHTKTTFDIDGKDASNAFTTNFIPSSLEITRSGLNARKALSAFKDFIPYTFRPIIRDTKSINEAVTTNASNTFQELRKYGCTGPILLNISPLATIFITASTVKRTVNAYSVYRRM